MLGFRAVFCPLSKGIFRQPGLKEKRVRQYAPRDSIIFYVSKKNRADFLNTILLAVFVKKDGVFDAWKDGPVALRASSLRRRPKQANT